MKRLIIFGALIFLVLAAFCVSADTNVSVSVSSFENINLNSEFESGGDSSFSNNVYAGNIVGINSNVFANGNITNSNNINMNINNGSGHVNVGINNFKGDIITGEEYFRANAERWSASMTDMHIYHLFDNAGDLITGNYKRSNPKSYREEEYLIAGALDKAFATDADTQQLYDIIMQLSLRVEALEKTLAEIASDEYCEQKVNLTLSYGLKSVRCGGITYHNAQVNGLSGTGLTTLGISVTEEAEEEAPPEPCLSLECNPVTGQCDTVPDSGMCNDNNSCTEDVCAPETGTCKYVNKPAGTLCGEARSCPADNCDSGYAVIFSEPGHDTCNDNGECIEYECEIEERYCSDSDADDGINGLVCGAECDESHDCFDSGLKGDYCYYNGYCNKEDGCRCVYEQSFCPEPGQHNDVCYYGNRSCSNIGGCGLQSAKLKEKEQCDPVTGPFTPPSITGAIIGLFS